MNAGETWTCKALIYIGDAPQRKGLQSPLTPKKVCTINEIINLGQTTTRFLFLMQKELCNVKSTKKRAMQC